MQHALQPWQSERTTARGELGSVPRLRLSSASPDTQAASVACLHCDRIYRSPFETYADLAHLIAHDALVHRRMPGEPASWRLLRASPEGSTDHPACDPTGCDPARSVGWLPVLEAGSRLNGGHTGQNLTLGYSESGGGSDQGSFTATKICIFAANGTDVANCTKPAYGSYGGEQNWFPIQSASVDRLPLWVLRAQAVSQSTIVQAHGPSQPPRLALASHKPVPTISIPSHTILQTGQPDSTLSFLSVSSSLGITAPLGRRPMLPAARRYASIRPFRQRSFSQTSLLPWWITPLDQDRERTRPLAKLDSRPLCRDR